MIRDHVAPRADWQADCEEIGFTYHSIDGTYWDESRCYRFTWEEVDTLEAAAAELHARCLDAVEHVVTHNRFAQLAIPGTNYGDYTEAIWGVTWQGRYIYVGATNNGIKVVDAERPASLSIVKEVPTSQYGGVSAGPLDAIGNVLVVTTPKESAGIATLDISDPVNPTRLASLTSTSISYIGMFYRHWIFLQSPVRAWDVLTNPRSIGSGTSPLGCRTRIFESGCTLPVNVPFAYANTYAVGCVASPGMVVVVMVPDRVAPLTNCESPVPPPPEK